MAEEGGADGRRLPAELAIATSSRWRTFGVPCALIRLGMNAADAVLVPYKNPIDNVRWGVHIAQLQRPFDLATVAEEMGYPLL